MSEWKEYKLGEIADVQTGPFGSQLHQSDYVDVGIPSIMPVNIGDRMNLSTEKIAYITEEDAMRLSRYRVHKGDIVYSRRGDVEKCAYINEKEDGWLCGTGCLRIRIDESRADSKFVAYYLSTDDMKSWISNNAVGTTMPNLNSSILQQVPLSMPSLEEQQRIASILSSLDDKIDLLNRENATLEAMAEAFFRQWFIEEAKEDWEEGKLDDILSVKGGTTPSTKEPTYWDGGIAWTSPRDVTTLKGIYLFETEKTITEAGLKQISSGLLPKGTLLMSSRAPVGVLAFAEIPLAINQGYIAILDDKGFAKEFIYLWLKANMDLVHSYSNGSTFMEISKSAFKSLGIQIPSKAEVADFVSTVKPYFDKMKLNERQIRLITKQRDMLLAKLMSNEITI
ncbi:MAG: restriction endonuclease subunit S [Prevotella sp.]|nr:restriction endonuclease subunit S [Prevotella sp.]